MTKNKDIEVYAMNSGPDKLATSAVAPHRSFLLLVSSTVVASIFCIKGVLFRVFTLTVRRLLLFIRDKSDLYITLCQAPLMPVAFFFVFQGIITSGSDVLFQPIWLYSSPQTIILLVVLSVVWFGSSRAIQEIPNSWRHYQQERLSFLRDFEFVISKFLSLSLITLVQVLLFALVFYLFFILIPNIIYPYASGTVASADMSAGIGESVKAADFFGILWVLCLVAVSSVAFAMFISSFISTGAGANAILPFYLIIQILLAGSVLQPAIAMNAPVYYASNFSVSRWGYEAVVLQLERALVLNMARSVEDRTFATNVAMNLTKNLRGAGIEREYVKDILSRPPDALDRISWVQPYWRDALRQVSSNPFNVPTQEELAYLADLEGAGWDISGIKAEMPTSLVEKAKDSVRMALQDAVNRIVLKVDGVRPLTGQEEAIWSELEKISPRNVLFRPIHATTTWLAMVVMSVATLLGAYFGVGFTRRVATNK